MALSLFLMKGSECLNIFFIVYLVIGVILETVSLYFRDPEYGFGIADLILALAMTATWPYWWAKALKRALKEHQDNKDC